MTVVRNEGIRLALLWGLLAELISSYNSVIQDDSLGCFPLSSSLQFG